MVVPANAAITEATVMRRSRRGVSQLQARVCSHTRSPLAPAAAVKAQVAHMAPG